jgi:cytosine/adenosine deaminase-related metal-dependent hydrolase
VPPTTTVDLLVRDSELLVTLAGDPIPGGWVAVKDGTVTATGRPGTEPAAVEVLSARGGLITPGLINTHHHIYQNLTRSYAPALGAGLFAWLTTLYPLWSRLDEEAAYVSAWIGLVELALGGCTTTSDHLYVHPSAGLIDAEIAAAREVGLRFHPTRGSMSLSEEDGGLPPNSVVQRDDEILEDCNRLIDKYHDPNTGSMCRIGIGPCSPFSVTPELMRASAELAEHRDVRLHTHLDEDRDETEFCLATFGCRPVEHFDELGWNTGNAWVAHCIFPNEDEMARLGHGGTSVAHCPSSNMLIAGGATPVTKLREHGVAVGLGCDGSASTDHASLWLEARTALLLSRLRDGLQPLNARDVLHMATVSSAACLGREGELGQLGEGAPADLVVWPVDGVGFAGAHTDLVEAWLRCGPVRARHTVVNGRVIVRDGELEMPGLEEMLQRHSAISREWQGVLDR